MRKTAVITGASGFIGTNLYNSLVSQFDNILCCDHTSHPNRETIPPDHLLSLLETSSDIEVVFHQGACSDTTCHDVDYMMKENFDYSVALFRLCLKKGIRFIYASSAAVYGDGPFGESIHCKPKNIYAKSKYLFDEYVNCFLDSKISSQVVGLRYFNVFGPHEDHKEKMASVVYQFYKQIKKDTKIKIFKNSRTYMRDFINVEDVIKINHHFLQHQDLCGIYNCGTGTPRSFYDIAHILKKYYTFSIEEIEMPRNLISRYQTYTCADNHKIFHEAQYKKDFLSLEAGIAQYVNFLDNK